MDENATPTFDLNVTLYNRRTSLLRSLFLRAEIRRDPQWRDIQKAYDAQNLSKDPSLPKKERDEHAAILKDIKAEDIVQARRYYGLTRRIDDLQEQIRRYKEKITT